MTSPISSVDLIVTLTLLLIPTLSFPQSLSTLPSLNTQREIGSLPTRLPKTDRGVDLLEYKIQTEHLPAEARERVKLNSQGQPSAPLLVPNTMIIQFKPDAPEGSIDAYLNKHKLTVLETYPELGAVKVEADLTEYFTPTLMDNDSNQLLLRGVNAAIKEFTDDPIVRSASPDVVFRRQADVPDSANTFKPSEVSSVISLDNKETIDWGIGNIEADKLWTMPGAQDGVLFGVMDAGFARHQDLIFIELPPEISPEDHGNHVAGIACARGRQIRGVLPNCFVRARTGDVFFKSVEGGNVTQFMAVFSQILGTLTKFILQYDDIRIINVSMGYNWRPNFGINPDVPESSQWRALVEQQGLLLVTVLELANKANKVIYSAAGNDSSGLVKPVGAKYASPFNWAAFTAREKGIARNGVVVEAHDSSNKRAPFSNVGGHISCPGVEVISTVAHDANGSVSQAMYGKMSGTSMAAPYCASAHVLFSLVRPGYSGGEIVDCLLASTQKTDSGAPILKLTQALQNCPVR